MSKEIHFKIVSPRSTFSSYNKRQLLEMLLRENFDPTRQEEVFHRIRSSRDNPTVAQGTFSWFDFESRISFLSFSDYFNEKAVESQQRIEHLMRQSRNDAFERLKVNAKALNDTSETNELQNNSNLFSVAMEAIASQENHPTPDEVDGIDVKKLYEWLANFMAGNPTEVDDGPTKEFLKECFTVRNWVFLATFWFSFSFSLLFLHQTFTFISGIDGPNRK